MSEGQRIDSQTPEVTSNRALSLTEFFRGNLDGEFVEVFDPGDDIGLPEANDTLSDNEGNKLGILRAERTIRPESKDFGLSFTPDNDPEIDSEYVSFRIPRYQGSATAYYEYTKMFKSAMKHSVILRDSKEAGQAIKEFGLRVGKMLGVSPKE